MVVLLHLLGAATQAAHPCDLCGPILKHILFLEGTHCGLQTYTCGVYGRQLSFITDFNWNLKHYSVEKPSQRDEGKTSLVKNCRVCEELTY